jgi:beta-glucosidase
VNVSNVGNVSGDEVVQIYISSNNKSEDRPVKLLKGFKRVSVDAGMSVEAEIEIPAEEVKFYDPATKSWKADSSYTVLVGTSSANAKPAGEIRF